MVIVLKKNISESDKKSIKDFLSKNKFKINEITGEEETIFGAVGKLSIDPREVEILPGVDRVIPISKPYKMASREFKKDDTVVEITNNRGQVIRIGGLRVCVIAGPCAVENRAQMFTIAKKVAESGAVLLRGGAYKPRTSPYAFQGLGEEGVKLLKEAGDAYGLPVVTEIVSASHIPVMKDYVDVFQIGARNMQNFELLKSVGALGKPVILKRGLSATIQEWLMAAEYLLSSGTDKVILCERGIRTYETATRNTLDLSAIPVLRSLTHLPIIVDPSHAVGIRDKVPPMALAAIAAGADGLIVEVHCNPEKALSDGAQSLYPEQFEKMMRDVQVLSPVVGREVSHLKQDRVYENPVSHRERGLPETETIVSYSGGQGAYAEQALLHYFDGKIKEEALPSFDHVFRAVADGKCEYGMIPLENSLAGSVYENYDNLYRYQDISIAGEIKLRIEHSLLAPEGSDISKIKSVYSHPQGFAQCRDFLKEHPQWTLIDTPSTSDAARIVKEKNDITCGAIASEINSGIYKLKALCTGIETDPRNYTRFVVIGRTGEFTVENPQKATLVFSTPNDPGALYKSLEVFHKYSLNLTKLESRPIQGQPWKYRFYIDVTLPNGGVVLKKAFEELTVIAEEARILGLYSERN